MRFVSLLSTGLLFFSKFSTSVEATELLLNSCENKLLFKDIADAGSFVASPHSCLTESGAMVDLCSGKTTQKFQPGLFKVMPEAARQEMIRKGERITIPAGLQLSGYSEAKCGGSFYLNRNIVLVAKKDMKIRHLKFTGDGRLIDLRDGKTLLQLKVGVDYRIELDKTATEEVKARPYKHGL